MHIGEPNHNAWVQSGGGPLLLLAKDLLGFWEGVNLPPAFRHLEADFRWREDKRVTDYDRACDSTDYIAEITVGPGSGLVLGDEPVPTMWLSVSERSAGILVRVIYSPGDAELESTLRQLPQNLDWMVQPFCFRVDDSDLILFDSAEPGNEILGSQVTVRLERGSYSISTAKFEPDADTSLLLHRLEIDRSEDCNSRPNGSTCLRS